MGIRNVFSSLKKKIEQRFTVEIFNGGPQCNVGEEIPQGRHVHLSDVLYNELERIAKLHNLTIPDVVNQIFKLGWLINKVEEDGGKIGIKKKDSKRIEYVSFLKDLDSKRQVSRLLEEVLKTIPKQEEN